MTNVVSRKRNRNERFIVSDSNRLAYAMAMNALDHPGPMTSPLLICGGIGTGKTHLLKALEHYLQVFHPEKKVKLITAERFKIDMIQALMQHRKDAWIDAYESLDVLLVDDVQAFIRYESAQEEFVRMAEVLLNKGMMLIFTSDRVPEDLRALLYETFDLVTSNQIVALETADETLKKQVALQKAFTTAHHAIPSATLELIVNYLASNENYDLRKLTGSIQRVILMSELTGEDITIEFAKKVGC